MDGYLEAQEMLDAAGWSDRFFNGDWTPHLTLEQYQDEQAAEFLVSEAAREFLRLFPDCPYNEGWLVRDYLRRL